MGKSKELAELGNVMSQDSSRVGINTQSPATGLHVVGAGSQGWVTVENTATNNYSIVDFTDSVSGRVGYVGTYNGANDLYLYGAKQGSLKAYTYGVKRLEIDSSGRVTMPYQPAFMAYPTFATDAGDYVSSWVTDGAYGTYQIGNHLTSDRFTAPVAGRYQINVKALYNTGDGTQYARIFLYVNGTQVIDGLGDRLTSGTIDYYLIAYSVTLNLNANDYVQLKADDYGDNGYIYSGRYTSFSGFLVG